MNAYFQIDGLQETFGDFRLGPVALEAPKNEYFVLLGPTGCGKTSLLRCIVGAAGAIKGRIFLDGRDIGALPPEKRGIGYVSQTGDLFPHLSVRKNIAFGLSYLELTRVEKQERLERYMSLFGVAEQSERSISGLSGGERKRVAIARSLIVEPRLLLLDEPLGMLDHNGRKEMLEVLGRIHHELRTTTIHVTHDRHEAWSVARTCAVMNNGKIIQTGTPAQLFRTPKTCFTAEFLGGANIFEAVFNGTSATLPWTTIELAAPVPVQRGWVLIRPERIRISSEKKPNKASGRITASRDFGEYLEIDVQATESTSLKVHASMEVAGAANVGRTVFLDWPRDAVHVMEKDEGL